jgi:hypothetical protein
MSSQESEPLLSADEQAAVAVEDQSPRPSPRYHSRHCAYWTVGSLVGSLILLLLLRLLRPSDLQPNDHLRSNGTHLFKQTVIMISIDGLRFFYYTFLHVGDPCVCLERTILTVDSHHTSSTSVRRAFERNI